MASVVEEICNLQIHLIDAGWAEAIYEADFLEFGDLPTEFENNLENFDLQENFLATIKSIDRWLRPGVETDEERSWITLSQLIPYKKLVALLAYYINYGCKNVQNSDLMTYALLASRVYYKLLSIPGYKGYHIYHSQLFANSLACLGLPRVMSEQESFFNARELTREVNAVIKELRFFVVDLRTTVQILKLTPNDLNFEDILSSLVEVTGGGVANRLNVDKIDLGYITGVVYTIIDILICDPYGRPNARAIQFLFKCLLPKLIVTSTDHRQSVVQASYVTYSGVLVSKFGKAALESYLILLEHLCFSIDHLERAEIRQSRVSLVVGLMSLLPSKAYGKFVNWLIHLSASAKILHRHIAIELLCKLLQNAPQEPDNGEAENEVNDEPAEPQAGTSSQTDLQPQPGTSQQPDFQPQPGTSRQPDFQPQPGTSRQPNHEPQPGTSLQTDFQPQPSTSRQPNLEPQPSTSWAPDFEPQPGTSRQQNFVPQPSASRQPNLEPQPSTSWALDFEPQPGTSRQPDLLPQPSTSRQPNLEPQPSTSFAFDFEPQPGTSRQPDIVPQPGTSRQPDFQPQAGTSQQPETGPQPETSLRPYIQPPPSSHLVLERPYTVTMDDDSSQDSQIPAEIELGREEEIVDLLRQRRHTVPHAQILRAMYDRAEDVSGTIRTRALAILTECLENHSPHMIKAVKELRGPGPVSALLVAGARGVGDERAAVRRAGAGYLQRLLAHPASPPPCCTDLTLLAKLCRDASIIVRTAAITAMNDLVVAKSSDIVVDMFLKACMPQLSDPETKVQHQVALIMQHLIMDRLKKFDGPGKEDPLPWTILAGVARNNMRRHLQKACTLIKNVNNGFNYRTVDTLSTHLGTLDDQRDLQCLVLLSCVARYIEYSNIAFVLDYYYGLAENEEGREARLMPLILEVISVWSPYLLPLERSTLRNHLVRRLANAKNDGCRIMCASLATQLDSSNVLWAAELMQLSERRAVSTLDLEEAIRAADLSLLAPMPPSNALLDMFLTMLAEPPAGWDEQKLGSAVAGAGRLCLRSRAAAARVAPALGALLGRAAAALPARVNAVLALADICTRYTCIVDPLLESVCRCLSTNSPSLLRITAARTMTRLLLGGFLRLRTPLYYRYCALLADADHDVREPAEYYVTSCLTTDAIYHHFVDCVVHYNTEHPDYKIEHDARQQIYDVMLQRMSLVQKLNLQCRLARDIIEQAAEMNDEGYEELPTSMDSALLDTITMLIGPRMKLPKKPQPNADGADIEELQERVKNNIVSHKMKRTVAEILVPAVLKLYSRMNDRGGQTGIYIVRLANELLVEYQQEIEESIENDEELIKRVRDYQRNIGLEPTFGNVRNLVTSSAPPDPETPHGPRRRPRPAHSATPRKRALRI